MLPEGVKPVSFGPAALEEPKVAELPQPSHAFRPKKTSQTSSVGRNQEDSSQDRPRVADPLIEVAAEQQPLLEPLDGGELQMDAPPLPRSRLGLNAEDVKPPPSTSVRRSAGVTLKDAPPLISLATEPQPFLESVPEADLQMDAPPLPEEVEPASAPSSSVPGNARVASKEANHQKQSRAGQGRKRKAKGPEIGVAVCVLCPREVAVRAGGQSYCSSCFFEDVSDKPRLKDGKRLCRVSKCDKLAQNARKYDGCCAWCARVMNSASGEDPALPSRSRPGQGMTPQQNNAKKNAKRTSEEICKRNIGGDPSSERKKNFGAGPGD